MATPTIIAGTRNTTAMNQTNLKPDILTTLFMIEPYATPIMQNYFFQEKMSKEVINMYGKYSHFEDQWVPHNLNVLVEITGGATTIVVNATNLDGWDALKIGDKVYSESTGEQGEVTATTATTATITRMVDGINVARPNWTTIPISTYLKIIGGAEYEGNGVPDARTTQEVEVYNYLNMLAEAIVTSGRQEAGEQYTNGLTHDEQVIKKMKEMKWKAERDLIYSVNRGYRTNASGMVQSFGYGIQKQITTNELQYAGDLTEAELREILRETGRKGSFKKTLYAGIDLYDQVTAIFADKQGNFNQEMSDRIKANIMNYEFGGVSLNIVKEPALDGANGYNGIVLDEGMDTLKFRYMAPDKKGSRKFRIRKVDDNGSETTTTKLFMDYGIEVIREEYCGKITRTGA